ncbi:MAG TPA: radical SAM protein [Syntrophales bacterium]|nr:radical SAM protein [Syntrophales bacterium]HQN78008.1 radical SAM protein [Syntrophales bacterium]
MKPARNRRDARGGDGGPPRGGADVLLVNPRYNGRSEIPSLGLACIAAPLLERGISVSTLDLDTLPREDIPSVLGDLVASGKPRIAGVTALSDSFPSALDACRVVKDRDPGVLTVMGGMHATVLSGEILGAHPEVDVVVRGEGEDTFLELAERVLDGLPVDAVEGISGRSGGEVFRNADRPLRADLDEFPLPAHHLWDSIGYRTRSVSSSRGCFHRCTFCSIQALYRRTVRTRSAGSLLEEIRRLVASGAGRILFTDENFTFSPKRVRELCAGILRLKLPREVEFYAEGRADDICRNPLTAQVLSDAGFRALYMGAESGSPAVLEYYGKGIGPGDILRAVDCCVQQNLTPVVNFILFGPRDTVGTIRETIALAKRVFEQGGEIVYGETLNPFPGTAIREALIRDGRYRESEGVYYFESYEGLNLERILGLCARAREMARDAHGGSSLFEARKTYHELSCLDGLLSGGS